MTFKHTDTIAVLNEQQTRMMVAAPAMLEALKEMQQALTHCEIERAMVKINAAIAMAEGRDK